MYAHVWLTCRVTGQVIGEEGGWLWEPYSSSMALRHWMEQRGAGLFAGLEPCPGRRNSDTEQLVGPLASFIGLDSEVLTLLQLGSWSGELGGKLGNNMGRWRAGNPQRHLQLTWSCAQLATLTGIMLRQSKFLTRKSRGVGGKWG